MRFCVFPKHYIHNFRDPETFPYEGTPVDKSNLTEENFSYFVDFSGNNWDFTRFNPEHFRLCSVFTCIGNHFFLTLIKPVKLRRAGINRQLVSYLSLIHILMPSLLSFLICSSL